MVMYGGGECNDDADVVIMVMMISVPGGCNMLYFVSIVGMIPLASTLHSHNRLRSVKKLDWQKGTTVQNPSNFL